MAALASGQRLGQRFTLIRALGEGGMGVVWLVEDRELREQVVVKLVPADAPNEWTELLRRECRNARRLVHPNIVRVYDLHQEGIHRFISMEYVEGHDIGRLRDHPLATVLSAVVPVADALDYAHRQGVVHRDLKSSNVLIDATGAPRILDFGIAGLLGRAAELGETPTTSDDIYGFGALLYELLSDRGEALPDSLTSLLQVLLTRDGKGALPSMNEVKQTIRNAQGELGLPAVASLFRPPSRPKTVAIVPPPRVSRDEMVRAVDPGSSTGRLTRPSTSGVGWMTIAAFAFLIGIAAAVFLVLPRWAPQPQAIHPGDDAPSPSAVPSPPEPSASLREQAELKTQAEARRDEAVSALDALEAKGIAAWGGGSYRSASAAIATGTRQLEARDYAGAAESFETAITGLHDAETQGQDALRQALANGTRALESGDAAAATAAFELARAIDPGNRAAATGLARARVSNDVVRLMAEGADYEQRGDLAHARESYRKAIALDGASQKARLALARVEGDLTEVQFRTTMSRALEALNQEDYAAARGFFEEAGKIRPSDPQVASGIVQAEEGIRLQTITVHRANANRFESQEQWHQAAAEYEAVLELDPTIRFAQEGKTRSDERAVLSDKLAYHLAHPERLSDKDVLATAESLLEDAERIQTAGPRLSAQRARIAEILREASTPVPVLLRSDNQTDVVVYQIGELGRFLSHTLQLRPGTYTVVGSRPGYRDVRVSLQVEAGKPPEPLLVRCEEEI